MRQVSGGSFCFIGLVVGLVELVSQYVKELFSSVLERFALASSFPFPNAKIRPFFVGGVGLWWMGCDYVRWRAIMWFMGLQSSRRWPALGGV